jgi:Fe-S cluster biogenesis protein NfuA/nitrite reductase/ring-hydroxylating ferredoxin subunit
MAEEKNVQEVGERIERLLEEIRSMASPPAWQRVEELMRTVVELYGNGLGKIVEVVATPGLTNEDIVARLLGDKLVESLLVIHGLHPEDFPTRVGKALDRVRPYLGSHGGGIELLRADEDTGEVKLRLGGSCDGCPSSLLTVKLAVEGAIKEVAPEVTRIDVEGIVEAADRKSPGLNGSRNGVQPEWLPLGIVPDLAPGSVASTEVPGAKVLLCRVGGNLYAYRDSCPSCESAIEKGELSGDLLTCPSCAERYDVRLAGRSIRHRDLHLDPFPLLEDDRGVRIAVGALA